MIVYKDILSKLSEAGYNTTTIRKEKILSESTLTKIRNNEPIRLDSLEVISKLTREPVENLVEFK
jgi:DNA-binding Xre family transcriptional regulator